MMLMSKGLWSHCTGDFDTWFRTTPDFLLLTESGKFPKSEDKPNAANAAEMEIMKKKFQWKSDDEKCLALLGMHVPQNFYSHITGCTTAYDAWEALRKVFYETSNATKLVLKCQFYDSRMHENETLLKYLDRVLGITNRLQEMGCATQDNEICYKILSSVTEKYKPLTMSCMMLPEDSLTPALLRQHFVLEDSRGQMSGKRSTPTAEAHNTSSPKKKCERCGGNSHVTSNCYAGDEHVRRLFLALFKILLLSVNLWVMLFLWRHSSTTTQRRTLRS